MAGRKHPLDEDVGSTTRTTRSKTSKSASGESAMPASRTNKRGTKSKPGISAAAFKTQALPLHINITHTPPVVSDDNTTDLAQTDPGFIGSTTLVPASFARGAYGWKGVEHATVELLNAEEGRREKVRVELTITATVVGKEQEAVEEIHAEAETGVAEETVPEAVEDVAAV